MIKAINKFLFVLIITVQGYSFAKIFGRSIIVICLIITSISCDNNRVFEDNYAITNEIWNRDSIVSFTVDITDTISVNNIYINIRNASEYPRSNIYLFVKTEANNSVVKDTFNCILADDNGRWYGSGLGDIWSHQMLYKKNVRFPNKGKYVFSIEQAMRISELPDIIDVGIRIEKAN